MSILNKKNALAAALVLGLGLSASANAYSLFTNGDIAPVLVATADIINTGTDIGINETFQVVLTSEDFILGRTTGFTIRYSLNNGATFGAAIDNTDLNTLGPNGTWTATVAAGGTVVDNFVVINFQPGGPPTPLTTGKLLDILAATAVVAPGATGQVLDDLLALQVDNQQIVATVNFIDSGTATSILPVKSLPILRSGNPVEFACAANLGDLSKRIDVSSTAGHPPKTYFSTSGAIGGADSGYINLGAIGTAVGSGFFPSFSFLPTDQFTTVVSGDFSAFSGTADVRDVYLSNVASCANKNVNGVINNTSGTVTFTYTNASIGGNNSGFIAYLCADVPLNNTVVIDASQVSAITTFMRGAVTKTSNTCPLLPLRYNGAVVEVYHLNPAGNTTAQSFLRVINPSDTSGLVTIVGTSDNGVDGNSPITFILGARKSMQINSQDLEFGNAAKGLTGAFGDGIGKWRAVVTGEFPGMKVQSLNRNNTDGTVTDLTDADSFGEQELNRIFDGGGNPL